MNSFLYDKPFKTYSEQIELIQNKNVIISDLDFAQNALCNISYYTLINGYKQSVLCNADTDQFIDGTTFEMLYTIHILDNSFNSMIFKYILFIEKSLKTKLAYLIGRKYGVYFEDRYKQIDVDSSECIDDYLHISHYSTSAKGRTNILSGIREYAVEKINKNSSTRYYQRTKNHVPPWILVNDLPFGEIIKWYDILIGVDKTEICDQMLPYKTPLESRKELLKKSLSLLKEFRNSIAHGNKTFANHPRIQLPQRSLLALLPESVLTKDEWLKGIGVNDILGIFIIIILLINDKYIINNLILEFERIVNPYEKYRFSNNNSVFDIFNIPSNVLERMSELQISKYR